MNDKEFYDWFVERAQTFADLGIMHPNSEWGKTVKIALLVSEQRIRELEQKIIELQSFVNYKPPAIVEKPKRGRKPKVKT